MENDQQKIRPETAGKLFPDYEEYPSIDETGSLEGMVKLYNWKPENCFLIDGYIYHLSGHPRVNQGKITAREKRMLDTIATLINERSGHFGAKLSIADSMLNEIKESIPFEDYKAMVHFISENTHKY